MDKSEYRAKLDQITAMVNAGDYQNAQTIVDEVDWRRVKSARTLCMVSEIYEANDRLPDSRKVLELAYKRALVKTVAYRLVEVCLKLKDLDAAKDYYDDFADLAPMDNSKYILKYKIHRAKGDPLSDQIKALEDYKEREYTEPWAYELAKLYSQDGNINACIEACDDLILWFSEGPYVFNAMELKKKYAPLSPSQQEKYNRELAAKNAKAAKAAVPSFLKQTVQPMEAEEKAEGAQVGTFEHQNLEEPEKEAAKEAAFLEIDPETPMTTTEEAIEKMDAAASSTVQADSGIRLSFGKAAAAAVKPAMDPARMQSQLADSIRNVFAGINNKGTVSLDTQTKEIEETYDSLYHAEDMSGYEIKDLEPETASKEHVSASDVVLSVTSTEKEKKDDDQIEGQMSLEDLAKKESEFDFEALFAETTNALAAELASGVFEKEKVVNTEEEADKVVAEEIARIVAEEAKENAKDAAAEDVVKEAEAFVEAVEETPAEESPEEDTQETFLKTVIEELVTEDDQKPSEEVSLEEISLEEAVSENVVSDEAAPEETVSEENTSDEAERMEALPSMEEPALETSFEELSEEEQLKLYGKETDESLGLTRAFDQITLQLDENSEEDELTQKIIAEAQKEVQKEHVELKSSFVEEEIPEELITDPEKVVLSDESKKELKILPLEPRPLTAQEKEIFTYFAGIPGLGEQITVALHDVHNNAGDKTSKSGNFLVIGRQGSGKTRLYESMVLAICKDLGMDAAKNAKIIARDLNHKDPAAVVAKLAGGFLAIEGAGELDDETAEKLAQAMEFRTDSLVVVLEDEKDDLLNMLEKHPRLAEKFTTTIKIPVFTNDELVTFAKIYAQDQGYRMDEMGILALYTKIGDNQKDSEPVTVGKVKDMMDAAMLKANKGHRKLSRRFSKNAVDEENRIILFEKDFE